MSIKLDLLLIWASLHLYLVPFAIKIQLGSDRTNHTKGLINIIITYILHVVNLISTWHDSMSWKNIQKTKKMSILTQQRTIFAEPMSYSGKFNWDLHDTQSFHTIFGLFLGYVLKSRLLKLRFLEGSKKVDYLPNVLKSRLSEKS